ncbi:MAG: hypothetical protein ACTTID_01865 [Bacillales bacterium]
MKVLKKIGGFFVVIWRWLKETAWVQPLIIVSCIFGIIFSIPPITKKVNEYKKKLNNGLKFYNSIRLSLEHANEGNSDVDTFLTYYEKAQGYKFNDEKYTEQDLNNFKERYGEKFFLIFTQSECDYCKDMSDAFVHLRDNWGELVTTSNQGFKAYSIVCNQDMGKKYKDLYKNKKPFEYILSDHSSLFSDMETFGTRNDYYLNADSSLQSTIKGNIDNFQKDVSSIHVPCVILFDLNNPKQDWRYLASTVFFKTEATQDQTKVTRAHFLAQCWNYEGSFKRKD